jgi:hypothetical protein
VALLLVSIVVLGLAAGIFTMLKTTQAVSKAQRDQAALTAATESIKSDTWVPCAVESTYAVPSGVTITTIEYLSAPPANGPDVGTFGDATTCGSATNRVQRVTVKVGAASAQIVKRDPAPTVPTP